MKSPIPSQDELHAILDYDPSTGLLTWKHRPDEMFSTSLAAKKWNAKLAGKRAFTSTSNGYLQGTIFGVRQVAHRVIWKWMTGEDAVEVDHINGSRTDNRWDNLRSVDRSTNTRNQAMKSNNTSGYNGVFWEKGCAKWRAQIRVQGKLKHLGVFVNLEDAIEARKKAESLYGFHPNHGRLPTDGDLS